MQDDNLLNVFGKNSFKTELLLLITLDTFFLNKCRTKLYSRFEPKKLLKKLSGFTINGGYKNFLNKCRTIFYSRRAPKNFYYLSRFFYSRWIQKLSKQWQDETFLTMCTKKLLKTELFILLTLGFFSKQMQDNTLLTVCSERLLVKLSFFQYSR